MTWIAIAAGGALGALARHAVNQLVASPRFPVGTAIANLLGCCAVGALAGLLASERLGLRQGWREFAFVGLLGGFTTFSAFGLETFVLIRAGAWSSAVVNVAVQVGGGLAAVWLGYRLTS